MRGVRSVGVHQAVIRRRAFESCISEIGAVITIHATSLVSSSTGNVEISFHCAPATAMPGVSTFSTRAFAAATVCTLCS